FRTDAGSQVANQLAVVRKAEIEHDDVGSEYRRRLQSVPGRGTDQNTVRLKPGDHSGEARVVGHHRENVERGGPNELPLHVRPFNGKASWAPRGTDHCASTWPPPADGRGSRP